MKYTLLKVLNVAVILTTVSCQLTQFNQLSGQYLYHYPGVQYHQSHLVSKSVSPLPSNVTTLFNVNTPYTKVDLRSPLPDIFSSTGIPAEEVEEAFDVEGAPRFLNSDGNYVISANSQLWPFLKDKDMSLIDFAATPCTVGQWHYHPFADEMNYVLKGEKIAVGVKGPGQPFRIVKDIKKGGAYFIPKGYLHFFINLSCTEEMKIVQFFNGDIVNNTVIIGSATTELPEEIISVAFNTDARIGAGLKSTRTQEVEVLRTSLYCRQRCGLPLP